MTGCIKCGAQTPNRTCRACRLAERVAEAAAEQEPDLYECPTCEGLSSSENVPCYKCRSEGQKIATDGGREHMFDPEDHVLVENLNGERKDAVVVGYHDTTAGEHELFADDPDRSTTTLARYWGDVDPEEPVVAIRYAKGVSWDGRVQTWSVQTYDFPESAIVKPETDGGVNPDSLSESDVDSLDLATDRVPEICEELELSEQVTDRACELARRADLEYVEVNRSPAAVAAGAVYLAACLKNEKRTQRRVSNVAEVSKVTIRDTYHEIAEAEGYEIEPSRGRTPPDQGWRARLASAFERTRRSIGGDEDV